MDQRNRMNRMFSGRRAFSLVELLVVIGIIALLIGILVPVVGHVRNKAKVVESTNVVNNLKMAVDNYHLSFRAYPGPFRNADIEAKTAVVNALPVTMAENLVLGLTGGLNSSGVYDANLVGSGPISGGSNPKQYDPFLNSAKGTGMLSGGRFTIDGGAPLADDSEVPEFVDKFTVPMPILYLRARNGAPGVIGDAGLAGQQYDIRHVTPYTSMPGGHGLTTKGASTDTLNGTGINQGYAYMVNPSIANSPRSKDTYILISAGLDGKYGTLDDICSFGSFRNE